MYSMLGSPQREGMRRWRQPPERQVRLVHQVAHIPLAVDADECLRLPDQ